MNSGRALRLCFSSLFLCAFPLFAGDLDCRILLRGLEPGITYANWKEARQATVDSIRADGELGELTEKEVQEIADQMMVSQVMENLLGGGRARLKDKKTRTPGVTPYDSILTTTRLPERTYHKLSRDFGVVLTLPGNQADRLWANLAPSGRRELIIALTRQLKKGKYVKGSDSLDLTTVDFAIDMKETFQEDHTVPANVGVSPQLMIAQASEKKPAGVCRHGACTLVGMLGELGLPNSNVRMVSGGLATNPTSRHIWVEVKLADGPNAKWVEIDPTPQNLASQSESINVMFALNDPDGPNSNRRKFSDHLELVENLLTPTTDGTPKARVPAPKKANP